MSSDSDDKDSDDNILILEIMKDRIDKDLVEDLNQNLFARRQRRRKISDDNDSDFEERTKKRNQKQDSKNSKKSTAKKSQDTTGPTSENMTSQKAQMSQADGKRKNEDDFEDETPPEIFPLRPIKTLD